MNKQHPEDHEPDTLRFEYDLDEPREKVWRAVSDPALVARWMTPQAHEQVEDAAEPEARIDYAVIDAEPPHTIRYAWREGAELDSVVRFSLAETRDGGTRLTIVHSGLAARATPAVAMAGDLGCRMWLGRSVTGKSRPLPANAPRMARAA